MIAESPPVADIKSLFFIVIFVLVSVAGCVGRSALDPAGADFSVRGKIGVRQAQDGASARFNWLQTGDRYDIEVWGPLGQGRTRLSGDAARMQVFQGDVLQATGKPDQIMTHYLGWSVPVAILPSWIKGQPDPNFPVTAPRTDDSGRTVSFIQAGWSVALSGFGQGHEVALPRKIVGTNGNRRVIVVVQEYLD
jgi:outer membrane lipoprotein LolB